MTTQMCGTSRSAVAVVIPTWNEERRIASLVLAVGAVATWPVVIADNGSSDRTAAAARNAGATVTRGGNPAQGRNAGAQASDSDFILFVDADVHLSNQFLSHAADLARSDADLVVFPLVPDSTGLFERICYGFANRVARGSLRLDRPVVAAPVMLVRRTTFEVSGGFDPSVPAAEDAEFVARIHRDFGTIEVSPVPVVVSSRRFELERPLPYVSKCVFWGLQVFVSGTTRFMAYRWESHEEDTECEGGQLAR